MALPYLGAGNNKMSVIYASDAASACIKAIDRDVPSGNAYFVDDGEIYVWRDMLADIERAMAGVAAQFPGAGVETKPVSVAFHVRNVAPQDAQRALDAALAAVADWDVHITEGKAVREFAVIDTDKGQALDVLRGQTGATAMVYFGDDVTDEKAFTRLGARDVGVKVGSGDTRAAYRVDTPEDIAAALWFLHDVRGGWAGS
mgnify:CR=1 FL=1